MDRVIAILGIAMLATFVAITWIGPKRYGLTGLLVVHLVILVFYFVFAGVSLSAGVYEYDGALSIFGLALQVFLLNCLLLPVGMIALWRRRRASRT
jgi:hypothetical protein